MLISSKKQFFFQYLFYKFIHVEKNWLWYNVALRKLFKLSDGLAKQPFLQWDILGVQLKSNWTVGERLPAPDQWVFWRCRLILFKGNKLFYTLRLKFIHFETNVSEAALSLISKEVFIYQWIQFTNEWLK